LLSGDSLIRLCQSLCVCVRALKQLLPVFKPENILNKKTKQHHFQFISTIKAPPLLQYDANTVPTKPSGTAILIDL
jgi:hypothetical protein